MVSSSGIQRHAPYRASVLTGEQVRALAAPRPLRVIVDTLMRWMLIIVGWAVAAWSGSVPLMAVAVVWTGVNFYALFIIGHDGMHRRLFADERANDLWTDLFVLAPMGALTRLNRLNHMRHHAFLSLPNDPDRYKYERPPGRSSVRFALELTGLPMLRRAAGNVFGAAAEAVGPAPRRRSARDWAILVGVNAALAGALTAAFGWWGYVVMWLLPVYVFVFATDLLRTYLEHALLPGEERNVQRLCTFEPPWWERQLFAPMNMNFHAVHHLYAALPYHALPVADQALKLAEGRFPELIRRRSYFGHLGRLFVANRRSTPAQSVVGRFHG